MSFSNKVVIVLGASGGIGSAISIGFAKEGASVTVSGRNEKKLQEVAEQCDVHGKKALVVKADMAKDDEVTAVVNKTIEKFGGLDVLVNSVGILKRGSVLDGTFLEAYDAVMTVNLRAAVKVTMVAAPHLMKTKGNIINLSLYAMSTPSTPEFAPVSISKAGLDHFTRCVALELSPLGVRVNTVNPGPVRTDILIDSGFSDAVTWDDFKKQTPLGRISEPEEVSDLVLFLASDKAKSITGAAYVIDNGILLKH